jgi:very-short-patch-repair endonuclease
MTPIYAYTDRQKEIEKLINKEGFGTQLEVPVDRFCIDILIPELDNMIVEIQGPQHYKRQTENREEIIRTYGYKYFLYIPVQYTDDEFLKAFDSCLKEIYGIGLKRYEHRNSQN